jgi:uncharacterized membrane protein (UPF0127 family)
MSVTEPMRGDLLAVTGHEGDVVCERCRVPGSMFGRARGLIGQTALPLGEGMLLRGVSAVHTFFMRFAIDVVFLDRHDVVVGIDSNVAPWRMSARRRARAVLELPAGEGSRRGLLPGHRLTFSAAASREEKTE